MPPLFFILVACIFVLIYLWYQYKFTYWARKGVFSQKPVFPYGNIKDVIKRKAQFFQPYCDNYFKYKHLPYIGMYCFHRPVLCVHDLELAKQILIKDFEHFQSRGTYAGGVGDKLAGHLFNIHGTPWKKLRMKMSPIFTPGKLKTMYPMVEKIANEARDYADLLRSNGESVNFSELYGMYAMDIIANIGFGVECNSFKNAKSEFYERGREYFDPQTLYWTIVRAFSFIAPDAFDKLKLKRISSRIEDFFYSLVKQTVEHRNKYGYKRNDFLQTLIELKNSHIEKGETINPQDFSFSMDELTANTMLYMIAGYETSATTGQFAAYHLALNPSIQDKVRAEIYRVLDKYGGECTYEAQNEMVYFNMVLDETMRLYPSMRAIFRRCTKTYQLNNDLVIEKGTLVFVPCESIQKDPEIFPDPHKFDPERFTPENKSKLHPCHWMPFGEGPRKCLGVRQGYIQSKMALVKILQKYELILDNRTLVPMKIKTTSLVPQALGGIWIKLRKLDVTKCKVTSTSVTV